MIQFILTDSQEEKTKEFYKKHNECIKKMPMATDGKYAMTFLFIPGGIGTIAKVKCNGCGEELNITEYENW